MAKETSKPRAGVMVWVGRVLSTLPVLMLTMSASMKLTQNPQAMEGFAKAGYPEGSLMIIGVVEIVCTILYVMPQTSVLGAILLTGYLGGATATHVIFQDGMWFMPVIFGVVIWLGLALREPRLWRLIPIRTSGQ